jgi:hypothetical protein
MNQARRPLILALVILLLGAVLIFPIFFGSLLFAYPSGGSSFHIGLYVLLAFAVVPLILAVRRFFSR